MKQEIFSDRRLWCDRRHQIAPVKASFLKYCQRLRSDRRSTSCATDGYAWWLKTSYVESEVFIAN